MLREISLVEAVQRMADGEQVRCMSAEAADTDWHRMVPTTLNHVLAHVVCFADCDVEDVTGEAVPRTGRPKKISEEDRQKIIALYATGWKTNNIAEEMGCHPNTVRLIIREEKERLEGEEK